MKKMMSLAVVTTVFSIASNLAWATSDEYPASDFQPKVVYIDKDAVSQSAPTVKKRKFTFDPDYPAADFEPKVVFIDKDAVAATSVVKKKKEVIFDPDYPAAYFQPKVIYP